MLQPQSIGSLENFGPDTSGIGLGHLGVGGRALFPTSEMNSDLRGGYFRKDEMFGFQRVFRFAKPLTSFGAGSLAE